VGVGYGDCESDVCLRDTVARLVDPFFDFDLQGEKLGEVTAHDRAILWTAHHPKEQQMLTASSDGTVKVWGGRN
jgi:WD40 repeat protein